MDKGMAAGVRPLVRLTLYFYGEFRADQWLQRDCAQHEISASSCIRVVPDYQAEDFSFLPWLKLFTSSVHGYIPTVAFFTFNGFFWWLVIRRIRTPRAALYAADQAYRAAILEGHRAYHSGTPKDANPFELESVSDIEHRAHVGWREGHINAHKGLPPPAAI